MDALFTVVFELVVTITYSEGSTRSALPLGEAGPTSNTYEKRYLSLFMTVFEQINSISTLQLAHLSGVSAVQVGGSSRLGLGHSEAPAPSVTWVSKQQKEGSVNQPVTSVLIDLV